LHFPFLEADHTEDENEPIFKGRGSFSFSNLMAQKPDFRSFSRDGMGTNVAPADSDGAMASKIYDRSIRLWGKDSQQRIISAKVLVVGLRSLSAEICKNLVLAGAP